MAATRGKKTGKKPAKRTQTKAKRARPASTAKKAGRKAGEQASSVDQPADMGALVNTLRKQVKKTVGKDIPIAGETEVQQAVGLVLLLGVATKASDIHISPQLTEAAGEPEAILRLRIGGVLQQIAAIDMGLLPVIIEEWKRISKCDVTEKSRPQDGRFLMRLPKADDPGKLDKAADFRVCFAPTGLGESLTVRILDPSRVMLALEKLDYAPHDNERLLRALKPPWGLVVISGPTGSGKTTVLYSCLNELSGPGIKAMSIEDPVEYLLPWVTQMEVNPEHGLTFTTAGEAIFRSDPDVVVIGEIRDLETLSVAHEMALTGHMVLTTMHVGGAAAALKRMVDIGSDPFVVAESTKAVLSQRLVRNLCPECGIEETPGPEQLDMMAEVARKGGLNWHSLDMKFRKAVGCDTCAHTGYRRRKPIVELLEVTPEIGNALRKNASVEELRAIAVGQGMTTMSADGIRRVASGETTLNEVMRVIRIEDW